MKLLLLVATVVASIEVIHGLELANNERDSKRQSESKKFRLFAIILGLGTDWLA